MTRLVSDSVSRRTVTPSVNMAAMRALARSNSAPHQADARQEQQPEHDIAEIPIAERVIDSCAEPRTGQRSREGKQHEPDHVRLDEAGCDLDAKGSREDRPVEGLENAAPLLLAPAAHAGPQDRQRTG